jgi:hypothetical protein
MEKLWNEFVVAEITGLSLGKLRNDRWKGTGIPYIRLGRLIRYRPDDVEAHIEQSRVKPRG